jgi:hypothetical protein
MVYFINKLTFLQSSIYRRTLHLLGFAALRPPTQ